MAGTKGIARFRGEQLDDAIMRDRHFDASHKIAEDKVNIQWNSHREILEDTKIDVWVQVNNQAIGSGVSSIDVTSKILNPVVSTGLAVEGTVLDVVVELRKNGTPDFPYIDADGDRVYGKLRYDSGDSKFYLDFYSIQSGVETAYIFSGAQTADFKYATRTNLSVIPVSAILSGGSGLVADAVDAKAYMNLQQLMKDVYGGAGTLDNDGNANLGTSLVSQIAAEVTARANGDQAIRDDLASTAANKGASFIGVVTNANYTGVTVQAVLVELAGKIKTLETATNGLSTRDAATSNNYFAAGDYTTAEGRVNNLEQTVDTNLKRIDDATAALDGRLDLLEAGTPDEYYFEAVGGETTVTLPGGKKAKPKTLQVFIRGAFQAPVLNYSTTVDGSGNITAIGVDALIAGDIVGLRWINA